jgi:bacteriocin-like protein
MRELNNKELEVVSGGTIFATIGKALDGIVNGVFHSELNLGETIGKVLDTPFSIIKNIFDSIFNPRAS